MGEESENGNARKICGGVSQRTLPRTLLHDGEDGPQAAETEEIGGRKAGNGDNGGRRRHDSRFALQIVAMELRGVYGPRPGLDFLSRTLTARIQQQSEAGDVGQLRNQISRLGEAED